MTYGRKSLDPLYVNMAKGNNFTTNTNHNNNTNTNNFNVTNFNYSRNMQSEKLENLKRSLGNQTNDYEDNKEEEADEEIN